MASSSIAADSTMQASMDVEATVNSVTGRWSVEVGGAEARRRLAIVATLEQKQAMLGLAILQSQKTSWQSRQEVEAIAGAVGALRASGVSAFHFLPRNQWFHLSLKLEGSDHVIVSREVQTHSIGHGLEPSLARRLPDDMWRIYIGREHELGEWLACAPQNFVWVFKADFALLRQLWLNACFTLPSPTSPITQCPNPSSRYCLDLTKATHWLGGKKVKRHKNDFTLTVNGDYRETFRRCGAEHSDRGQGTWITPELIDALDKCRREDGELKVFSIELWEKSTGELAAAIMALSVGDIFHDYTMATLKRDKRSVGAILSKVVGHLLVECGYTLWYWGFKNPYMAEYDNHYGGFLMDSQKDFWPRWKAALRMSPACDLATRVPSGSAHALDLASL